MKIYGIAILSLCYLAEQVIGALLGLGLAFKGNIGGVAFGMLFLIVFADHFKNKGFFLKVCNSRCCLLVYCAGRSKYWIGYFDHSSNWRNFATYFLWRIITFG